MYILKECGERDTYICNIGSKYFNRFRKTLQELLTEQLSDKPSENSMNIKQRVAKTMPGAVHQYPEIANKPNSIATPITDPIENL